MPKLPYIQFYPGDWKKDPRLSLCTPATRGVWIDLLCDMHENNRSGKLCGTAEQLARSARCSPAVLLRSLTELQTTKTADVTFRNNYVTVINRRMHREHKEREGTRLRVQRFRGNEDVTVQSDPSSLTSSSSSSISKLRTPLPNGSSLRKELPHSRGTKQKALEKELMGRLRTLLGSGFENDAGKWFNRAREHTAKVERVVAECENAKKENRIRETAAQYLEDTWKRFA